MDYYQMVAQADNRRRTLLQEAEKRRLGDQTVHTSKNGLLRNLRDPALYRLGTVLVRWGDPLQARYNAIDGEPAVLFLER